MNKLTQKDDCGNWGLKGVSWSDLVPGAVITQETYKKVYAALWKLMNYEGTELTPEEVERVNDFDRSQSGIILKKLNEEQRKHRWIPVSERLPEDGETVLVTVHTSEWISNYCSVFISDDEKIHHPESYNVYIGRLKNDGWIYFDETGSETYCCEKFGADKGVVYDVVIAWIPLPEPYKGGCDE